MKISLKDYPRIKPTKTIIRKAYDDKPQAVGGYYYRNVKYKVPFYLRAKEHGGLLHICLFATESLRAGNRSPRYEIFIDAEKRDFTTYDRIHNKWRTAMIDNLDMPSYMHWSGWTNVYADRECERLIKKHLQMQKKRLGCSFRDWQQSIREAQLLGRFRKETDPWDEAMNKVTAEPKDWQRWVSKVGLPEKFIIYKYNKSKTSQGWCSHCEKDVVVKKPRNNRQGRCPNCHSTVTYKAEGRLPQFFDTPRHWVYLPQKYGDGFIIRQYVACKRFERDNYRQPHTSVSEQRRCVCPANEVPTTYYMGWYHNRFVRWIYSGKLNQDRFYYSNDYGGAVYRRTLASLKGLLSRTGLIEYINCSSDCDPETFYAMYLKFPIVEQLAKVGLTNLIKSLAGRYSRWDKDSVLTLTNIGDLGKALKIDKSRLARLRSINGGLAELEWLRYEKATDLNIPDDVISWLARENFRPDDFKFVADRMSYLQIKNYITRQVARYQKSPRDILSTWKDYLAMATRLKMNTADEIVYKVKKLYERHDELLKVIEENGLSIRAGEILERLPDIETVMAEVSEKYTYMTDEYSILAPLKIEDVLNEGQALSHCIDKSDRYFERISQRESYLLFLRKTEEPDKPWYTLEVEPDGTIRQKRTEFDRQKPDLKEAEPFLRKWQKEIQKRLTAEDAKLAAESHDKRAKDIDELRKNNVRIHGGDFAGQLLADVLEADLMELAI